MPHPKLFSAALLMAGVGLTAGCYRVTGMVDPPAPLGSMTVDPIFQQMESNAEASDFVIYEHEFVGHSAELNAGGQDHLKQIAARLPHVPYPVLIAQSQISTRERDSYQYPVHYNERLDVERRDLIIQALTQMGVPDAQQRVAVGRALAPAFQSFEAERAYGRGFQNYGGYGMGFGGGFGGGGGGFF